MCAAEQQGMSFLAEKGMNVCARHSKSYFIQDMDLLYQSAASIPGAIVTHPVQRVSDSSQTRDSLE